MCGNSHDHREDLWLVEVDKFCPEKSVDFEKMHQFKPKNPRLLEQQLKSKNFTKI